MEKQTLDAVVVGAGPAGLAAALSLGRMRRSVLVVDSGHPRNAGVSSMHNFFSRDGDDPAAVRARARDDLRRYDTVQVLDATVTGIEPDDGTFTVTADATVVTASRVILATGMVDQLPDIPGVADFWGKGVYHCPYCHGFESSGQPVAVLGSRTAHAALALQLARLGCSVTLCTGGDTASDRVPGLAASTGLALNTRPLQRVRAGDGCLEIDFAAGPPLRCTAIYTPTTSRQAGDLVERLGCALLPDGCIAVDDLGHTSVPGVLAAGDAAKRADLPGHVSSVINAAAAGTVAGATVDHELLALEYDLPHP
jgi:thioredoxin reductase